jgi:hypothetical protein
MFSTVRLFIKTGILFLAAGLVLGGYMLFEREINNRWPNPYLVSAHAHVVLVGFVMFLILGVALWLFPRAEKDDTRYRPGRITAAYVILTASTATRFVAEASRAWSHAHWLAWGVLAGGFGQIAGIALYCWTMWSRIRPVGSRAREAAGEKF